MKNRICFLAAALAVFPLALNFIDVMMNLNGTVVHILTRYASVIFFAFILAVSEFASKADIPRAVKNAAAWVISVAIILNLHNYYIKSNNIYMKFHLAQSQQYAWSARLIARLEAADGYSEEAPVIFIGAPSARFTVAEPFSDLNYMSFGDFLPPTYSYPTYLNYYMGFLNPVSQNEDFASIEPSVQEILNETPVYPEKDSIKVIDGKIYVKFK